MKFPEEANPELIFQYFEEYLINKLQFKPKNFIHIFAIALALLESKKNKYGCVFVSYPEEDNYFGESAMKNSFNIGYKIYNDDDPDLIDIITKEKFLINDDVLIIFKDNFYRTNVSQIGFIYHLIKHIYIQKQNKNLLNLDPETIYQNITDLFIYKDKIINLLNKNDTNVKIRNKENLGQKR